MTKYQRKSGFQATLLPVHAVRRYCGSSLRLYGCVQQSGVIVGPSTSLRESAAADCATSSLTLKTPRTETGLDLSLAVVLADVTLLFPRSPILV